MDFYRIELLRQLTNIDIFSMSSVIGFPISLEWTVNTMNSNKWKQVCIQIWKRNNLPLTLTYLLSVRKITCHYSVEKNNSVFICGYHHHKMKYCFLIRWQGVLYALFPDNKTPPEYFWYKRFNHQGIKALLNISIAIMAELANTAVHKLTILSFLELCALP